MILALSLAVGFLLLVVCFLLAALWDAKERADIARAERNQALNARDIWCMTSSRVMSQLEELRKKEQVTPTTGA